MYHTLFLTERKMRRLEEKVVELEDANEELSEQVGELTLRLDTANRRLRRIKQRAKAGEAVRIRVV